MKISHLIIDIIMIVSLIVFFIGAVPLKAPISIPGLSEVKNVVLQKDYILLFFLPGAENRLVNWCQRKGYPQEEDCYFSLALMSGRSDMCDKIRDPEKRKRCIRVVEASKKSKRY
ncbi:hypothetical protein J7J39_02875 [bacterium]|nr:hypothetical protein [bacterium]